MPWANNPILMQSAWKRCQNRVWKWKVICMTRAVKAERKKRGFELVKWTDEDEKEQEQYKRDAKIAKRANKKRQRKEEEEEEEDEDEDDSDDDE